MSPLSSKSHSLPLLYVLLCSLSAHVVAFWPSDWSLLKRQTPASPLVDFEVSLPILTPLGQSDQDGCVYKMLLMEYEFANSYGVPFVGSYTPPPCTFNRVTMNLTVTSKGRQFDRLGVMYLGDIEVFRTSTAEPTANGIIWIYTKEMEQYNALWRQDQKIIFDLGNLIDDTYTGPFFTTLTATFFTVPDSPPTADIILPISAEKSATNLGSAFIVPDEAAMVSYTFPQNIERAVVSLSVNGQIGEEFWYTNVFSSQVNTFEETAGTLGGFGPFREVQLLIDGQQVGAYWPFPTIFTGGIVPGLWRPIVGIEAFDLEQHEIDVTTMLPLLCDGAPHTFEIRVLGLNDNGDGSAATISNTVGSYWVVTGTIFLFLGEEGSVTTGVSGPMIENQLTDLSISSDITTNATGVNETLTYTTAASRSISINSIIKSSSGTRSVSWTQALSFTNYNAITAQGFTQYTQQTTQGTDRALPYQNTYTYPLTINSTFSSSAATSSVGINATLSLGLTNSIQGPSVFPSGLQTFNITTSSFFIPGGSTTPQEILLPADFPSFKGSQLSTTQSGSAQYFSSPGSSYSFGTTEQDFVFRGENADSEGTTVDLYGRHVRAVNSSVVEDEQIFVGQPIRVPVSPVPAAARQGLDEQTAAGDVSVRALLGRGLGAPKRGIATS